MSQSKYPLNCTFHAEGRRSHMLCCGTFWIIIGIWCTLGRRTRSDSPWHGGKHNQMIYDALDGITVIKQTLLVVQWKVLKLSLAGQIASSSADRHKITDTKENLILEKMQPEFVKWDHFIKIPSWIFNRILSLVQRYNSWYLVWW